jgi:TetR/AcrR family transcriptional regulator, transcriptional repressor for nem operon
VAEHLKYHVVQARRQMAEPSKRRGERTRDKLKLAAVEVLGEVGYHDLRIADICERVGVSPATFYLHFDNRTEITIHVLTEFLEEIFNLAQVNSKPTTPFQAMLQANLRWIEAVRQNAGLMRSLVQVGDEVPQFALINQRANYAWYRKIALSITKRFPQNAVDESVALLAAYGLGAMMDEITRKLVVYQDPHFLALLQSEAPSNAELAEFLSLLWYRALYAANPPDHLKSAAAAKLKSLAAG